VPDWPTERSSYTWTTTWSRSPASCSGMWGHTRTRQSLELPDQPQCRASLSRAAWSWVRGPGRP
jgi:hypothetical protein